MNSQLIRIGRKRVQNIKKTGEAILAACRKIVVRVLCPLIGSSDLALYRAVIKLFRINKSAADDQWSTIPSSFSDL